MLLPTLIAVAALFALLLVARLGGARRADWLQRWPALACAGAALLALTRGALGPAVGLAALSVLAWYVSPRLLARPAPEAHPEHPADASARKLLGLPRGANEAEIRRAYRDKIARAHPDRGGSHAAAAQLTAARDRLLKGK
jgi:DnaJ domain